MARGERTRVVLRDGSQDQLCLHHGKVAADAQARSTSERKMWKVWTSGRAFRGEALRVEHLRILPKIGMAVRRVGTHPDEGVRRNKIAPNFVIGNCLTIEAKNRWIEP